MRALLFLFTLSCSSAFLRRPLITRQFHLSSSVTYIPIEIKDKENPTTLLVKSDQHEVIADLRKMMQSSHVDSHVIEQWKALGHIYTLDAEGTQSLMASERKQLEEAYVIRRTSRLRHNVDAYFNVASAKAKPKLIKASSARDYQTGRRDFESLQRMGEGFSNVSDLFVDYSVLSRADNIATRISTEFPLASPEWQRYTNKTVQYNATSLTQVSLVLTRLLFHCCRLFLSISVSTQ